MNALYTRGLLSISFFSLLLASFNSLATPQYQYTIIHNLLPFTGYNSEALTINNNGAVAGYYQIRPERFTGLNMQDETPRLPVGFIYRPATGVEIFEGPAPQKGIEIIDLNDNDQFLGQYYERYIHDDNGFTSVGIRRSYFIQHNNEREDLTAFKSASVINNNGEVLGLLPDNRVVLKNSIGIRKADNTLIDILSGVDDCDQSVPDDCSGNNRLDFDNWSTVEAMDMNDLGQVVFVLGNLPADGVPEDRRAYVFKPGEGIKLLLNTATRLNQASINNQGMVLVGYATDYYWNRPSDSSQTWIFSADGQEQTLLGGLDTSSWHPHKINNSNTLLGYEQVAFSLTDASQVPNDSTFPELWDGPVGGNSLAVRGYKDINDSNAITVKTWDGNIKYKAVVMTPIVNNETAIHIDGEFDDWSGQLAYSDATDDGGIVNWDQVWTHHDTNFLSFSYLNTGSIDGAQPYLWSIYLDTDKRTESGYNFELLGADFLVQGKNLYMYTGTGQDWSWSYLGDYVSYAASGNRVELSILKNKVRNTEDNAYKALFHGADPDGGNVDYLLIDIDGNEGNVILEESITSPGM
jgi:hypothetical protein